MFDYTIHKQAIYIGQPFSTKYHESLKENPDTLVMQVFWVQLFYVRTFVRIEKIGMYLEFETEIW